jgi:hypothetical protein
MSRYLDAGEHGDDGQPYELALEDGEEDDDD